MSLILILTATIIISYLAWLMYSPDHKVAKNSRSYPKTKTVKNNTLKSSQTLSSLARLNIFISKRNININGYLASDEMRDTIANHISNLTGKRADTSAVKVSTNRDENHYRLISVASVAAKYINEGSIRIENNRIFIDADFKTKEKLDFLDKLVRKNLYRVHNYEPNLRVK